MKTQMFYQALPFTQNDIKQYMPGKGTISRDIAEYNYLQIGAAKMIVITIDNVKNGYIIQANNERWIALDYEAVKKIVQEILQTKEYSDD